MKKSNLIIILIILVSFAIGVYFYPQMPDEMASHWNIQGEVDDYMPKFWGLFVMPLVSLFLFLLFLVIPKIDPLKKNIEKFRKYFDWFIILIILFLSYIYLLAIFWNLGFRFNMGRMITPSLGILFFYVGILLKNAKRNWFIGIRTPWTLSSDVVWDKTHKLGSKLFKAIGVIAFLGILLPNYILWVILIPILTTSLYLIIYSYVEYKRETENTQNY